MTIQFHEHHAATTDRSPSTLSSENFQVSGWLATNGACNPYICRQLPPWRHDLVVVLWSLQNQRWVTRSRRWSRPLPCSTFFLSLHSDGPWRIRGRLGCLLWRCWGDHLVLRSCCRRCRRRWSLGHHGGLAIPGWEHRQLRLGHGYSLFVHPLLCNDHYPIPQSRDDGESVVQLLSHGLQLKAGPDNWMAKLWLSARIYVLKRGRKRKHPCRQLRAIKGASQKVFSR
jgi:hypothetical protein